MLTQAAALVELAIGDYAPIRSGYQMDIAGAISEYLESEKARVTKYKNQIKRAITESFPDAFYQGYQDGGGGGREEVQPEDDSWLTAKMNNEYGFVDMLFEQLKALKAEGPEAYAGQAEQRAEGYAKTLDGVYNEGRMRGAGNKMLTFGGNDGQESCKTCQKLKGKRHRASWWVKHGLTIFRGNPNYECGCWNCEHFLFDDNGNLFTF